METPKPGHRLIKKIVRTQEDVAGAAAGTTRMVFRATVGAMLITDFDPDQTAKILEYMESVIEEHIGAGQEINGTTLAEDACRHFDLYMPDNEASIPDDMFELSFIVGQDWEKKQQEAGDAS